MRHITQGVCLNDIRSYVERVIYLRYDIALQAMIYACGTLRNGYYIIFSRRGNISYGFYRIPYLVRDISFLLAKEICFFGSHILLSKYVTHYYTFKIRKSYFALQKINGDHFFTKCLRSTTFFKP